MQRKKTLAAVTCAATLTVCQLAQAQLSLTGTSYTENFNGVGTSLPTGWTVRTGATTTALGGSTAYTAGAGSWDGTAGAFKNLANAAVGAGATQAVQNAFADRSVGIRQSGAFGDPGAGFTLQIGNTLGRTAFSLSLDAEMLSVQTRSTTWTLQYATGFLPNTFTDLATYTDPGAFGVQNISIPAAALTAIENQSTNVWIRMVTTAASTGAGNRDTFAIDNFNLAWTGDGPALNPRTLTWAAGGNWEAGNTWLDGVTPTTYDSTNPDRAVFSNGALPAAITVGTQVVAGSIAFNASAPVHTFSGSEIILTGPLTADQSVVFNNGVVLGANSTWAIATGESVTMNGALAGSALTKNGTGDLILNAAAPAFGGGGTLNGGTTTITAVDGTNTSGMGNGNFAVNNGATVHIRNVAVGTSTGTTAPNLTMNNGATLLASGSSSYGRSQGFAVANGTLASPNTINIMTTDVVDTLTFQNSLRQVSAGTETFATIRVSGPGRVILESGGTTANTGFGGSWQLDGGILQIGPVATGGVGAAINALGFKGGDAATPFAPNAAVINAGATLAIATDVNNGASGGATSVRNPLTLNGGALATSVLTSTDGGKYSGNLTVNSGSILLNDPVGAPGVARNLTFMTEANVAGNIDWAVGSTLNVAGLGFFKIARSSGTASVGAGAQVVIHPGASLGLAGTTDPLSDGVNHVDVVNNSVTSLVVSEGTKNVGNVSGVGNTGVKGTAVLIANHIRQNVLNIDDQSTVRIRAGGQANQANRTSVVKQLLIGGGVDTPSARLDLNNNSMIIDYTGPVGTLVDDTRKLLNAGSISAGAVGIVSSAATPLIRLGYGDNDVNILKKTSFAGQPVDLSSVLVKFTYAGDLNLDGQVDITDLGELATNWQTPGPWTEGDFNYDNFVDITDLGDLATNWQAGVGNPLGPDFNSALAAVGLGGTSVPEPAALSLLGAAALVLRRRRLN